ncbi:unnamed protein product [Ascophyllum nodosum]
MNENLKLPTPLIYVRQGCRSTIVVTNATARSTFTCRHYRCRRRKGQTQTQTMQTLWCVLRRDTTSVDMYGPDAGLDYGNTMVRTTERHDKRRHHEGQTQT